MVNRMRSTKSHRNNRRSHDRLLAPAVTLDEKSSVPHLRHRVSLVTGQYRGRQVLDIQAKITKRAKREKEKSKDGR